MTTLLEKLEHLEDVIADISDDLSAQKLIDLSWSPGADLLEAAIDRIKGAIDRRVRPVNIIPGK